MKITIEIELDDREAPSLGDVVEHVSRFSTGLAAARKLPAGANPTTPPTDLLQDVLNAFQPGEERLWSVVILKRLAKSKPSVYTGWEPGDLTIALRPLGVQTRQIRITLPDRTGVNRRGVIRRDVQDEIARRSDPQFGAMWRVS